MPVDSLESVGISTLWPGDRCSDLGRQLCVIERILEFDAGAVGEQTGRNRSIPFLRLKRWLLPP